MLVIGDGESSGGKMDNEENKGEGKLGKKR